MRPGIYLLGVFVWENIAQLLAVVGIQVHLLNFAHQGIAGVCAGALVIEGLLHHFIQPCQEIFLADAVILDGRLDTHTLFQGFDGINELFQLLFVGLAA